MCALSPHAFFLLCAHLAWAAVLPLAGHTLTGDRMPSGASICLGLGSWGPEVFTPQSFICGRGGTWRWKEKSQADAGFPRD